MIKIYLKNNEILSTLNGDGFYSIVQVLKKHKCTYNPETKEWAINKLHYEQILEDLDDVTTIDILNESSISTFLKPVPEIRMQRIPFEISELKFPPIKGKAPYEDYQLSDLQKTVNRNRFALFLDVGTGKSWIILSALEILRKRNKIKKIVYLTSNSGVYDIKEKFLQFTSIPEEVITVGDKNNRLPFNLKEKEVIIANYRSFLLIADEYHKNEHSNSSKGYRNSSIPVMEWLQGEDACFILDESHNIANPKSRQSKVIHQIKEYFSYRYVLSGTPADKEEKYYSQLNFLDSALVNKLSYYEWLEYYTNLGTRFSKFAISSYKPARMKELQELVKSNCSRRLGEDVLDLPPNLVKILYTDMTPLQSEIYKSFITERVKLIQSSSGSISSRDLLNIFPKLLMAVDNPEKISLESIDNPVLEKKIKSFQFLKDHPKIEVMNDIIADHPDSKIIIWTSHPSVGFYLQKELTAKNPFILNGEIEIPKGFTGEQYKNKIVEEFKKSKDRNILIAGIQVLNTAVTIVEANVQIYFDTDYSYTNTEQSYARIYRLGQKQKVYTYKILLKNSLDITRHNIMEDKNYINDHFLSRDYASLGDLQTIFLGK